MADITGIYEFYGLGYVGITIRGIDASGALIDSFLRDAESNTLAITGHYDDATGAINFTAPVFPGFAIFAAMAEGFAMKNAGSLGGVQGLAGLWRRQTIKTGNPGEVARLVFEQGGWFATNHQVEIV